MHGLFCAETSAVLLAVLLGAMGCDRSESHPAAVTEEPAPHVNHTRRPSLDGGASRSRQVSYHVFGTAREALETILATKPRVIGFGEYHELTSSANVQSTVRRFTEQLLDLLAKRARHLIVETWVEAGRCGESEERVSKDVRKVTERPAHTQNELVRLMERAKELGISPHILELRCADYEELLDAEGQVDYEKLLQMVTRKLSEKAVSALDRTKEGEGLVALYGGSLHNDLYPYESVADFSYGRRLQERSNGRYVEVDLYVPEYIEGDELLTKEDWYPVYEAHSATASVLLIERGPGSYILVLERGKVRAPTGKPG